ncbi:universal stress protein [Aquisalimonas sp.]|uniref:universal stress protein n=1 Tax=unclassified Aquisalimonas TaxID=2644645 RepID=UPI0025BFAC73|nr:universal stress protein [Aquisalimonas sp.]
MTGPDDRESRGGQPDSSGLVVGQVGVRRVVVLLDASRGSLAALDAAAAFARASRVEFVGWFVAEDALVHCAGYPWAREVGASGAVRPMQPGEVEQRLRDRAEAMRLDLERIARAHGLQARLQVYRGRVIQTVLRESTRHDFLVLGKVGYGRALGLRVGSTARELMARAPGPVMIYEPPVRSASPAVVAVVVPAGEEGLRALEAAVAMTRENGASLAVLLPREGVGGGVQREHAVRTLLQETDILARVQSIRSVTADSILQVLREESAQRLVIPRQWGLQASREPADLVEDAMMPVVVVP